MKKVIITGVTGQDGSFLADFLLENTQKDVVGCVRRLSVLNHSNIEHLKGNPRFRLVDLDVTDQINTDILISEEKPDYFINLAANSFVGNSWKMPINHMRTNAMPVMYQLEAIRKYAPKCRYYNAGTSEQFGDVKESPQTIDHPFSPRSPYGVAKCAAHNIVKVWRESYGLYAVQGILFNHEGVRRGNEFVTRKISKGVAKIKCAIKQNLSFEPIRLGNLYAERDWSDAEDLVQGIWRMVNQERYNPEGKVKDYILASGESHSIKEFVELAFDSVNITGEWVGKGQNEKYKINRGGVIDTLVEINKSYYRPNEVHHLLGDPSPAEKELKWIRKSSFEDLVIKMTLNDYEIECKKL